VVFVVGGALRCLHVIYICSAELHGSDPIRTATWNFSEQKPDRLRVGHQLTTLAHSSFEFFRDGAHVGSATSEDDANASGATP